MRSAECRGWSPFSAPSSLVTWWQVTCLLVPVYRTGSIGVIIDASFESLGTSSVRFCVEKCFTSAWLRVSPRLQVAVISVVTVVITSVCTPSEAELSALCVGLRGLEERLMPLEPPTRLSCLHALLLSTPIFSSSPSKCFLCLEGLAGTADL